MLVAGFDLRHTRPQVGHVDPTTALRLYAQLDHSL
jgi:hypothetical protein